MVGVVDVKATDADLYARGAATLIAAWKACARGSRGAAVIELPGVAAAVFPSGPERAIYNNALLERGLTAPARADALEAMEAAYASAGVTRFAAWTHESDGAMRDELEARGYVFAESTRAMGMPLGDLRLLPRAELELGPPSWSAYVEYLQAFGLPRGLLSGVDPNAFHVLIARLEGRTAASALAFDHDGDCGVYNVSTLEWARRRGLGTALTVLTAHDAVARGCHTASLQATEAAERIYAAVGFRDLGRILEYAPPP